MMSISLSNGKNGQPFHLLLQTTMRCDSLIILESRRIIGGGICGIKVKIEEKNRSKNFREE